MRHGVPENYEHDVDEKLLEEIREEQRSEKERGGPKIYRKGTTVSSVYAYSSPQLSTPTAEVDPGDASSNNSISTTNTHSTNSMSMAFSNTNTSSSETFAPQEQQQKKQQQQAKYPQKKRDVQQISLDRDEMTVAQFLATSGSKKASKSAH